jgi:hypothetical protein
MPSPETIEQMEIFSFAVSTLMRPFSVKATSSVSPVAGSRRISDVPTLKVCPTRYALARAPVDVDHRRLDEDHVAAPVQARDLGHDERHPVVYRLLHRRPDVGLLELAHVSAEVLVREPHREAAALALAEHLVGGHDLARRRVDDVDHRVDLGLARRPRRG